MHSLTVYQRKWKRQGADRDRAEEVVLAWRARQRECSFRPAVHCEQTMNPVSVCHSAPKPTSLPLLSPYSVGRQSILQKVHLNITASVQFVHALFQITQNWQQNNAPGASLTHGLPPYTLESPPLRLCAVVIALTLLRTTDQAAAVCSLQSAVSREHELRRITDNMMSTMTTPEAARICHFREGETAVGHIHCTHSLYIHSTLGGRLRSCYIHTVHRSNNRIPHYSSISGARAAYE